ncbi:hypothetical protein TNCV_4212241 [Trichonephila clavipes]|nr:hypothetical protein TNCV_4212241 [Trichonephila clavipes]
MGVSLQIDYLIGSSAHAPDGHVYWDDTVGPVPDDHELYHPDLHHKSKREESASFSKSANFINEELDDAALVNNLIEEER